MTRDLSGTGRGPEHAAARGAGCRPGKQGAGVVSRDAGRGAGGRGCTEGGGGAEYGSRRHARSFAVQPLASVVPPTEGQGEGPSSTYLQRWGRGAEGGRHQRARACGSYRALPCEALAARHTSSILRPPGGRRGRVARKQGRARGSAAHGLSR